MDRFIIVFLAWNVIVMLIYGIDKFLAITNKRRISEKTLLLCAFLLGSFGAMFGMVLFNHKTSKSVFRYFVPTAVIITLAAIYYIQSI